jgi:hypothetical protein
MVNKKYISKGVQINTITDIESKEKKTHASIMIFIPLWYLSHLIFIFSWLMGEQPNVFFMHECDRN